MNQGTPAPDRLLIDIYKVKNRPVAHLLSTNYFIMKFTESRRKKNHRNKKNNALVDMFTLEDHKMRN